MTFLEAVASFYLILPVIFPGQKILLSQVKKNSDAKNEFIQRQNLIEFLGNYSFENIAEENFVPFDLQQLDEKEENKTATEIIYKDSLDKIRLFEFGEEQMSVGNASKNKSVVSVNDEIFTLSLYDDNSKLSETVVWKNARQSELAKMMSRTSYFYENGYSRKFEDFEKNTETLTAYNEFYLPDEIINYSVSEDEKKSLIRNEKFIYDEEKRLTEHVDKSYFKKNFYDVKDSVLVRRYLYTYKEEIDLPDVEYYENNVLRLKTVYKDNSSYEETAYFDGNIYIHSVYEDGVKVSQKILSGEKN